MRSDRGVRSLALVLAGALAVVGCGSGEDDAAPSADTPADPGSPAVPGSPDAPATAETAELRLSFRVDPRLTTGLYLGERWVSPPTFTMVQEGGEVVVHARVHAVAGAYRSGVDAAWSAAEPDMIEVSPPSGHEVTLAVRRVGTSAFTVTFGETSTTSTVHATNDGGVWRVDVVQ